MNMKAHLGATGICLHFSGDIPTRRIIWVRQRANCNADEVW